MTAARPTPRADRRGFTLIEVMISGVLLALLALFVSATWVGFGRALADGIRHAGYAQDRQLVLHCLQRDLGGQLADWQTGTVDRGRLIGRFEDDHSLFLCYEGEPANGIPDWSAPDRVIQYLVEGDRLVRLDRNTGQAMALASHVDKLHIENDKKGVEIKLSFEYPFYNAKKHKWETDKREFKFYAWDPLTERKKPKGDLKKELTGP